VSDIILISANQVRPDFKGANLLPSFLFAKCILPLPRLLIVDSETKGSAALLRNASATFTASAPPTDCRPPPTAAPLPDSQKNIIFYTENLGEKSKECFVVGCLNIFVRTPSQLETKLVRWSKHFLPLDGFKQTTTTTIRILGVPSRVCSNDGYFCVGKRGCLSSIYRDETSLFFNKDICSGFPTPQSLGFQIHTSLAFFNNQDGISFKILDLVCVERDTQKGCNRYGGFRAHKVSADGLIGGEAM